MVVAIKILYNDVENDDDDADDDNMIMTVIFISINNKIIVSISFVYFN